MLKRLLLRYPNKTRRILEIIPGLFSWTLILFPIWGSLLIPQLVAYYVITFAVYWLYRSIMLAILSIIAQETISRHSKLDWLQMIQDQFPNQWQKVHHIIVIPTYKEPITTLERTLNGLQQQSLPLKQIHIILSFEEREGMEADHKARILQEKYSPYFGNFWTSFHPDIAGEVKGKSSNTAWGARQAKKYLIDELGFDINYVTITSEDADAVFHHQYFSCLTFKFLTTASPHNLVWQGHISFYNNIWKVPAPVRVMASVFSINQMYILMRKDRLINFSTYSTSLKHIVDIDFWDTDVIPEDYRLFFKSYFSKHGQFDAEPIFLPIYADAAESTSYLATIKNQYQQLSRWAWGVSDDAYIIRQFFLNQSIPFWDKAIRVFKVIEDHFLWPVNWFAVTISAFFPPLLNQNYSRTIIGKTLPQITSSLLTLSLVSLLVVFVLDAKNRPPRPDHLRNPLSYLTQPLEFLLLPVIGFFFSALPGIDSHTRLMFGKYIEYKVTEKV